MNGCEHEAQTLAWLYGDGSDEQLHHVVGCEACTALVDEHERVAGAVAAIAPALRRVPVARSAWRPALWAGGALLAAAVALFAVRGMAPEPAAPMTEAAVVRAPDPFADATATPEWELDLALDDLDAEVDALSANLDML